MQRNDQGGIRAVKGIQELLSGNRKRLLVLLLLWFPGSDDSVIPFEVDLVEEGSITVNNVIKLLWFLFQQMGGEQGFD